MDSIIVALITGGMSLIGVVISAASTRKKQRVDRQEDLANQQKEIRNDLEKQEIKIRGEIAEYKAATDSKIDALKEQVEKHNGVVERTYQLEEQNKTLFENCKALTDGLSTTSTTAQNAASRADEAHNRLDRAGIVSGLS